MGAVGYNQHYVYGAAQLPESNRKNMITDAIESLIEESFNLAFDYDVEAVRFSSRIRVSSESSGKPMSAEGTMIAAMCAAGGYTLAARNIRDFEQAGIDLINPWGATQS